MVGDIGSSAKGVVRGLSLSAKEFPGLLPSAAAATATSRNGGHPFVDFEGTAFFARKGDFVQLTGQFQTRTYTGQEKWGASASPGIRGGRLQDPGAQEAGPPGEPEVTEPLENDDIAF
jgi:hypothetical protein